mmetsp:Transcript_4756/g.9248  ORF Transcript_4756/g.9248 Transcript_4756/m.9248 type:complete len:205 (+) Transcript_4756:696-1310(+)
MDRRNRVTEALRIFRLYIRPGSKEEINISYAIRNKIVKALQRFEESATGDGEDASMGAKDNNIEEDVDRTVFERARREVLKLIQTDIFTRFLGRKELLEKMGDDYWNELDQNGDGQATWEEYKDFIAKHNGILEPMREIATESRVLCPKFSAPGTISHLTDSSLSAQLHGQGGTLSSTQFSASSPAASNNNNARWRSSSERICI